MINQNIKIGDRVVVSDHVEFQSIVNGAEIVPPVKREVASYAGKVISIFDEGDGPVYEVDDGIGVRDAYPQHVRKIN